MASGSSAVGLAGGGCRSGRYEPCRRLNLAMLLSAIAAEPPQNEQAAQRDRGQVAERDAPTEHAITACQVEGETHPERAEEPARVARHAVQTHRGAAQALVCRLHGPGGQRRAVEIDATFQATTARTASKTETPIIHPVSSDSAAAAIMAHSTTQARP